MWSLSDDALIAGLAVGDEDAASAFVRRFQRRVFGLARTIVGDDRAAEDVAQEAFVRAWRHAGSFDPRRGTVVGWLLTITRNLAIDAVRVRRPLVVDPAALVVAPPGRLAEAFEALGALADPMAGAAVLAGSVLAGLDNLYARLLETASPVTEASAAEVLVAARHVLAGERASAAALPRGMRPAAGPQQSPGGAFEQAFDEMGIFPAVRPS